MADKPDDIQQEMKKGRQDIAHTRSAIAEKLTVLEERVQETVDGVKRTFDLHYQVRQRPWLLFGGSLLVGYMLGQRDRIPSRKSFTSSYPVAAAHPQTSVVATVASQVTQVALGIVLTRLGAWVQQVLAPTGRRLDSSDIQPQSMQSPRPVAQRVIDSNTNGHREL